MMLPANGSRVSWPLTWVDLLPEFGEIALLHQRGGQREVEQRLGLGAEAFSVEEEEGVVAADGSADHSAVLVLDQLRDGGGEEVASVQVVVPQEVVQIAVETVGAGLQGRVDDAAGRPSDFGRE